MFQDILKDGEVLIFVVFSLKFPRLMMTLFFIQSLLLFVFKIYISMKVFNFVK